MRKDEKFIDETVLFSLGERWKTVHPSIRSYVRAKALEGFNRADLWKDEPLLDSNKRHTFAHQALAYRIMLDFMDEIESR